MDTSNTPTPDVPPEVPADKAVEQVTTTPPLIAPKKSNKLAIILMVWPVCALVLSIALYALVNYLTGVLAPTTPAESSQLFSSQPPLVSALNVVLFIMGALAVALGPISFIVGIVLLIIRSNRT